MTDIVWLMDMDFRVTYQSPSSEKLRGFTSGEIKYLPMEKNLTPESLKVALESLAGKCKRWKPIKITCPSTQWNLNITARRQAEEALNNSLNRYKALVDAIPDLMFRLSSQGVFLDYKAAKENLAFQEQSILGKNIRDVLSPEFADMVDEK